MNRFFAIIATSLFLMLALNGCHYYVKMMPDVTISSQPFPVPQNNHLAPQPETIVLELPTVKVPNNAQTR